MSCIGIDMPHTVLIYVLYVIQGDTITNCINLQGELSYHTISISVLNVQFSQANNQNSFKTKKYFKQSMQKITRKSERARFLQKSYRIMILMAVFYPCPKNQM